MMQHQCLKNRVTWMDLADKKRPLMRRSCRRSALGMRTRALLNMDKKSSNGAVSPKEVESEVERELHYRLATSAQDTDAKYSSVAWSVHNRLVDSFNQTHDLWK